MNKQEINSNEPSTSVSYTSTMSTLTPTSKLANPEGTKNFQEFEDYYQYLDMKCKELMELMVRYNQFLNGQKASSDYYLEPTELW